MLNKYYPASIRWILSVSLCTKFVSFPIIVRWNSEATSKQNCAYESLHFADAEGIEERNRGKATKFLKKLANLREPVCIGHVCSKDLSDLLLCGDWNARWSFPFGPRWPRPFVATRKMDNSIRPSFSLPISFYILFVIFVLRYEIAWYPLGNAKQCQLRTTLTRIEEGKTNWPVGETKMKKLALCQNEIVFSSVLNVRPIWSDVSFA